MSAFVFGLLCLAVAGEFAPAGFISPLRRASLASHVAAKLRGPTTTHPLRLSALSSSSEPGSHLTSATTTTAAVC